MKLGMSSPRVTSSFSDLDQLQWKLPLQQTVPKDAGRSKPQSNKPAGSFIYIFLQTQCFAVAVGDCPGRMLCAKPIQRDVLNSLNYLQH
jgi:hypothetical protein